MNEAITTTKLTSEIVDYEMHYEPERDMLEFWNGEAEIETEPIYQVYEIISNALRRKDTLEFTAHLSDVVQSQEERPKKQKVLDLLFMIDSYMAVDVVDRIHLAEYLYKNGMIDEKVKKAAEWAELDQMEDILTNCSCYPSEFLKTLLNFYGHEIVYDSESDEYYIGTSETVKKLNIGGTRP